MMAPLTFSNTEIDKIQNAAHQLHARVSSSSVVAWKWNLVLTYERSETLFGVWCHAETRFPFDSMRRVGGVKLVATRSCALCCE